MSLDMTMETKFNVVEVANGYCIDVVVRLTGHEHGWAGNQLRLKYPVNEMSTEARYTKHGTIPTVSHDSGQQCPTCRRCTS